MELKIHPDALEGLVRDGELAIPFYDTGSAGDGRPTVVLVHGTGGTASSHFRTLFPMFTTGFRVLALDLQPRGAELSVEDLSFQVGRVLEERCPGRPVHLLGYSLGALVAVDIAAAHPEMVSTLTLVAGWVKADAHQKLRNRIWARLYDTDRDTLREFATWTSFGPPFLAAKTESEIQALVRSRVFPPGIAEQMRLNREADISDRLAGVIAPTLVIAGTHDQMVPSRQTQLLYGGIVDARYAVIDAGHAIPTERPAQLFQIVAEFVRSPSLVPAGELLKPLAV
ncbi:hypothetical protein AS188_15755 (plasmid) [Kocuria flava]|uniref:Alpha/beta hydrolase n=1 Tax=Kocuria flava TaxID=446860 RepID=A0A0U3GQ82_9MICC|nr:alpha/beta hydrolase [Kocuria flava]ALU41347.1 hypothetical protein AS188_15755 [Kocuria flava]GEO93190.1 alpha/beta hydrolase [Kocuria flava]